MRTAKPRVRGVRGLRRGVAATGAGADADVGTSGGAQKKKMTYTYLGGNSWLLALPAAGVKVLCDPWLVGDLTFWDLPMLYVGRKTSAAAGTGGGGGGGGGVVLGPEALALAEEADVILLSQGWEDHAHRPTLRALSKDIPVIASPAAAEVASSLGFRRVTALRAGGRTVATTRRPLPPRHAHEAPPPPGAMVWATAGASVGPPWAERELGFIIAECEPQDAGTADGTNGTNSGGGTNGTNGTIGGGSSGDGVGGGGGGGGGMRVYYEPHCSYDVSSVATAVRLAGGGVDVAITPVRSVDVAGFPLVNGGEAAADLLGVLGAPRVVLPLRNGELQQEGWTTAALGSDGVTAEGFAATIAARFPATRVVLPEPGVALEVEV